MSFAKPEGMADEDDDDDDNDNDKMTHVAWAMQRRRKGRGPAYTVGLPTGVGRIDPDGTPRMFLDREPKAGYGSYDCEIVLLPRGVKPKKKVEPQRPGQTDDADGGEQN